MIKADLIADSTHNGIRIETWELQYPRFIHAELMTHRQFSRNAASSRAIPIAKVLEQVLTNPAQPVEWGTNQSGMQAGKTLKGVKRALVVYLWKRAAKAAAKAAGPLKALGLHKQIVNRLLEPFVYMKVVVTATEWNNWYHLRNHQDAQPEIRELAKLMYERRQYSVPRELKPGEWHVPYVTLSRDYTGTSPVVTTTMDTGDEVTKKLSWEDALKISSSCCAQVSYRALDTSMEKALKIYDQLVTMRPVHASPFEHQATPMKVWQFYPILTPFEWEEGVTHVDKKALFWSGNFKGWIQHRQLIEDHVVEG